MIGAKPLSITNQNRIDDAGDKCHTALAAMDSSQMALMLRSSPKLYYALVEIANQYADATTGMKRF